jgi:branched-chain amino acid transport system ATP-binding protein
MFLEVKDVCKNFDGLQALHRVDFCIEKGQLKSIIGPNGAGKTTFFNLIAGVLLPSSGHIRFKGRDITRKKLHQISRLGITKTYQISHVFPRLTTFENVRISAQTRVTRFNFWKQADRLEVVNGRAQEALEMVTLGEKQDRLASELSHGETKYLEIAIALATQPEILLLDEPTAGMSPAETRDATKLIRHLTDRLGLTVILVEHDMSVVMEISDEVMVLHEGRKLAEGTCEDISCNQMVQRVYLGERRNVCWS